MADKPVIPEGLDNDEPKQGMKFQSGYMIYVIMVVIALIAAFGINYITGVSKSELTTFKAETQATIDSMSSDLRASKDSIKTALDGLNTNVANKVEQSLGTITARITALEKLENDIKVAKENSLTATNQSAQAVALIGTANVSIQNLATDVGNLKTDVLALQTAFGNNAALTAALARITTLEQSVVTLQNQYSLTTIAINTAATSYSFATGIATSVPLTLTNTATTNITVPMKLVLNTAGVVVVTTTSMDRANTVSFTGTTITYLVNIVVPANSTITSNQSVVVNFTGTSPNAWVATWSKQ